MVYVCDVNAAGYEVLYHLEFSTGFTPFAAASIRVITPSRPRTWSAMPLQLGYKIIQHRGRGGKTLW
jgi:hypothetical protein